MRTRIRHLARNQDGVAAVEFAMIAPAFFALLLAVIDVSRFMWVLNTMQYSIDEAVRYGVIQELPDDEIEERVVAALTPINSSSNVNVTVESDTSSVTVTASSTYSFFFPLSVAVSETTIDLRSEMPL